MSTRPNRRGSLWIGLFGVVPQQGRDPLEGASGAYVNAVGLAENGNDFRAQVAEGLRKMDLIVEEDEDVELFSERLASHEVDPAIQDLARESKIDGLVRFNTFHCFEEADD